MTKKVKPVTVPEPVEAAVEPYAITYLKDTSILDKSGIITIPKLKATDISSVQVSNVLDKVFVGIGDAGNDVAHITIPPTLGLIIPTGLKIDFFKSGLEVLVNNLLDVVARTRISVSAFGFNEKTGELLIFVQNHSDMPVRLTPGRPIAKMSIIQVA